MIDGLKPYPEYKASGQTWVGRIPTHWNHLPNRAIFKEVKERGHPDEEMLSVTIKQGVICQKTLLSDSSKKDSSNQNKSAYKLVCPNDIAYNKMRAWQGAIGVSKFRGIVSPAYVIMRLRNKHNPRYFHYLFRTPQFAKEAERWSYGITSDMWSLRPEHFKMIYAPLPPPGEQIAIVKFLDHANRRLNHAIKAKQKVIALLNEQKQVIIHRAVTRGLGPDVPLKPSGVSWLGDIPKHWGLSRLKFEASDIVDCLHSTPLYASDGEYPAIRTADIEPGRLRLETARKISETQFKIWTSRLEPKEGDILYSREGERFGIAASVPYGAQICISQRMMVFRIKPRQCSEYIMWQLNCPHVYRQASIDIIGSTSPHVNVEIIKNFKLVIPPRSEQEKISSEIRTQCDRIENAIFRTEHQISLLQEFRTRLTADVVTGKLDVREAALRIPDEVEADDFSVESSSGYDDPDSSCLTDKEEFDDIDSNLLAYGTGANR